MKRVLEDYVIRVLAPVMVMMMMMMMMIMMMCMMVQDLTCSTKGHQQKKLTHHILQTPRIKVHITRFKSQHDCVCACLYIWGGGRGFSQQSNTVTYLIFSISPFMLVRTWVANYGYKNLPLFAFILHRWTVVFSSLNVFFKNVYSYLSL